MASELPFGLRTTLRVGVLAVVLIGFSAAVVAPGFHGWTLLLGGTAAALVFELHRLISRSNEELTRFLDAARYGDFTQRFEPPQRGAGSAALTQAFEDVMARFKASRQAQEETLRHLKALTEHSPVPLISLLADGHVELHNNAARRLFGNVEVNVVDDLRTFGEDFFDAMTHLEPGERRLVRFAADGIDRQLTVVSRDIVMGTESESLVSMQDIQSELDSAQLQAWRDLVRVLTHEITNSITPVASLARTAADLVDDARARVPEASQALAKDLENVGRAVDTVARRSDALKQFVRSYRSLALLPDPQRKSIPIGSLLERIEALMATPWTEAGITLDVSVEPEGLRLSADPDLMEQLLINLLKNAEEALTDVEEPTVSITARLNPRGFVLIEVSDNGAGVPDDIAGDIFVPFFTTRREGTGVGLALARQIMMAHGGTIAVGKAEGGGARFSLVF